MASTDRPNPGSAASAGSTSSSPSTAAASAGTADRARPSARASNTTPPITAARSTLGDGRASTTKPSSAAALSTAATRGSARSSRSSPSTVPATITRLLPDTAVKWLRPAARKSSRTSPGRSRTSPTASPGSNPAGPSGSTAAAARRPSRNAPAPVCHHGAGPTSCGAPRTRRTATVRSARVAGASKPSAPTSCPGRSADQPAAGAISSTRPPPVHRRPPVSAARSVAGTRTCAAPGRPTASPERRACGSSRTTTVRVAAAPRSAAARSGCACSASVCAVTTRPAASAQPAAAATTAATGPARRLPRNAATSAPPARPSRDHTPGRTGVQADQDDHPRRQSGRHQPQVGRARSARRPRRR